MKYIKYICIIHIPVIFAYSFVFEVNRKANKICFYMYIYIFIIFNCVRVSVMKKRDVCDVVQSIKFTFVCIT